MKMIKNNGFGEIIVEKEDAFELFPDDYLSDFIAESDILLINMRSVYFICSEKLVFVEDLIESIELLGKKSVIFAPKHLTGFLNMIFSNIPIFDDFNSAKAAVGNAVYHEEKDILWGEI